MKASPPCLHMQCPALMSIPASPHSKKLELYNNYFASVNIFSLSNNFYKMSTASKVTLATTLLGTVGIVGFVHWAQTAEKAAMHAGVVRDMENQRRKAEQVQDERRLDFEMQKRLEQEYLKSQTVHDSTTGD